MNTNRFSIVRRSSLLTLVAVVASACGSDSSTEPEPDRLTIADMVGSWKASSLVMTSQADPSQQFDIVAAGGEFRVTVLNHGGARAWLDLGDFSDEWDSQWTLNGDQLTSTPVESSRPTRRYTVLLEGTTLTATGTDGSFDFSFTGAAGVPANETVVLVRQ